MVERRRRETLPENVGTSEPFQSVNSRYDSSRGANTLNGKWELYETLHREKRRYFLKSKHTRYRMLRLLPKL